MVVCALAGSRVPLWCPRPRHGPLKHPSRPGRSTLREGSNSTEEAPKSLVTSASRRAVKTTTAPSPDHPRQPSSSPSVADVNSRTPTGTASRIGAYSGECAYGTFDVSNGSENNDGSITPKK